eukprot:589099_1
MSFLQRFDWIHRYQTPDNAERMAYINFSCLVSSSVLFAYFYARSVSPVQFKKHYGEKLSFTYAKWIRQACFAVMFVSFYHFLEISIESIGNSGICIRNSIQVFILR